MSFALTVCSLVTPALLGAPLPCPEGQTPAPVAVVGGAVEGECIPANPGETTKAASDEASRYEAMEKAAPKKVEEFRGGSVGVYISAGAAVVILVVVLLIILL